MTTSGSCRLKRGASKTLKLRLKAGVVDGRSGKVTVPASYTPCREQRKVILYKVVSGGPDQAVGETSTDHQGEWHITPQGSAGITLAHFYAKVRKLSEGTAGTIYVCQGAKSRTVAVSHHH